MQFFSKYSDFSPTSAEVKNGCAGASFLTRPITLADLHTFMAFPPACRTFRRLLGLETVSFLCSGCPCPPWSFFPRFPAVAQIESFYVLNGPPLTARDSERAVSLLFFHPFSGHLRNGPPQPFLLHSFMLSLRERDRISSVVVLPPFFIFRTSL